MIQELGPPGIKQVEYTRDITRKVIVETNLSEDRSLTRGPTINIHIRDDMNKQVHEYILLSLSDFLICHNTVGRAQIHTKLGVLIC